MIGDRAQTTIHETKPGVIAGIIVKTRDISVSQLYGNWTIPTRSRTRAPISRRSPISFEFNPVTQALGNQPARSIGRSGPADIRGNKLLVRRARCSLLIFLLFRKCISVHYSEIYVGKSRPDG